jgi:hypothetical protein
VSVEQSPEVEAVEAARAHLDEVDQGCAREWDTQGRVSEETALAYAAAFEAYNQAVNLLPERDFKTYVPF